MILHWYLTPVPKLPRASPSRPCPPGGSVEGLKAEGGKGAASATAGRGLSGERSSCSPSPKPSTTFTNTYINTLHTAGSLGGRLPTEAWLTQLHVSEALGKGAGLRVLSPARGRPRPGPPPLQGSVCPVWRVAVGRFGGLRLGLQGAGLAALTGAALRRRREGCQGWSGAPSPGQDCRLLHRAHLSVLREVVVQQL